MRVIQVLGPDQFITTPWKNGGGITHEITRQRSDNGFAWRLSIAEVDQDGPFSIFEGMSRILTVIEGAGLHLISDTETLYATCCKPCAFSGETVINSRLIDGPIRDFNVIYDPTLIRANVQVITASTVLPNTANRHAQQALYAISGSVSIGEVTIPQGHVALFATTAPAQIVPHAEAKALLLLVSLQD